MIAECTHDIKGVGVNFILKKLHCKPKPIRLCAEKMQLQIINLIIFASFESLHYLILSFEATLLIHD